MKSKVIIIAGLLVAGVGAMMAMPNHAYVAAAPADEVINSLEKAETADGSTATGKNALPDTIKNIINILLFIVGILSLIMIIYGGIRYTASGGKDEHIKTAKNTIMYAIIGLVVAILGFAIVNFVISSVGDNDSSGGGSGGSSATTPPNPVTQEYCDSIGKGFNASPPPRCVDTTP